MRASHDPLPAVRDNHMCEGLCGVQESTNSIGLEEFGALQTGVQKSREVLNSWAPARMSRALDQEQRFKTFWNQPTSLKDEMFPIGKQE